MNCSACGTQLPQGAANCPQCGAATPYNYSYIGTAPNDPTVVSFPDSVAEQPPPPVYGSQSYGAAAQSSYGSPPYQNPYEPYDVAPPAPPPPSPQRPGKRIGIIAGVVLLVLLLIGSGVFAWFESSLARNAAAAAAVATTTAHTNATATASAIVAAQNFTAKGTYTILGRTTTVRQNGSDKIYSITEQDVDYGDVMGSYTSVFTSIVHPDNTANFSGTSTCTCTVAGKSGTLMWSFTGTSTANGSFQGQDFDIHGTGDLAKLHGQGTFQGQGTHGTYATQFHFDS